MSAAARAARRRPAPLGRIVLYALMVGLAAFYLVPVYILLATALKTFGQVQATTPWELPAPPTFGNFGQAFGQLSRPRCSSSACSSPTSRC